MRVLFTSRPYVGHVLPMMPLATALAAAGHDIGVASGGGVIEVAQRAGFRPFPVGLPPESISRIINRFPTLADVPPGDVRAFLFANLMVGVEMPPRATDLERLVDHWRPDVLVHDIGELAAPLVATLAGIPFASHSFGPALPDAVARAAGDAAAPLWSAASLTPHPTAGLYEHLYLDVCPPLLQTRYLPPAATVQPLTPLPSPRPDPAGRWAGLRAAGRPVVYVTMGTVFNEDITMFETVLQGLELDDLTVVVTVGDQADGRRLDGHKNTHVERFVPQAELLPHCDLVITHGGAGTVLGALAFGVPLVVLPLGADHFDNAAGVVAAGAGIRILPQDVTAASIGAASRSVLSEPVFRAAATRVRDQIAAMPQPEVAARAVLRLARNTSTSN